MFIIKGILICWWLALQHIERITVLLSMLTSNICLRALKQNVLIPKCLREDAYILGNSNV